MHEFVPGINHPETQFRDVGDAGLAHIVDAHQSMLTDHPLTPLWNDL